jgi:hypothetical protein
MNIQLVQGEFSKSEALELISKMIHVKIKYHEEKINSLSNEEDIKTRERKITFLQNQLSDLRANVLTNEGKVKIEASIQID